MKELWHDLTLRVVTPAFLGQFDPGDPRPATAPFPVPSLRGVLAYWLRALAGAHLGNAIDQLHDVESAVFGAARSDQSGRPSPIQIRGGRVLMSERPAGRTSDGGMRYLMGPGLTSGSPRCLMPGPLELRVRNLGTLATADLFLSALWALRAFGGVGARTRRGFGTLAVDHVPGLSVQRFDPAWLASDSVTDLGSVLGCVAAVIGDLGVSTNGASHGKAAGGVPGYPCFEAGRYRCSADEEDQLQGTAGDWQAALDNAGAWFWGFRHGANRRVPGSQPPSGTHSQTYNDVVQPFLDRQPGHQFQKGPLTAGALGLPIPYTDHQGPRGANGKPGQRSAVVNVKVDGQETRRASPLWLRVRHDGAAWRLRSLAFHSEWLPPAPRTQLMIKVGPRSSQVDRPTDDQVDAELRRWFDA